ncbi:uncharacterized protein K452DRAFT_285739 [Aplosporella prunicola CBS 121167]|uniref:Uncharacterized protein n=1 Tax=Aplosporella prunicola CBS 121167 TaxID=1176127 RepID=A0A6A6BMD0_9PEZI|nr:uncharacterized protein K452DRAFT_285739 [Aplosporella prunicola CBS 121167]KAF2143701.1 hypothetical protein K452DRAFT_285739 [Aplosporella prunicola CBS 121167]
MFVPTTHLQQHRTAPTPTQNSRSLSLSPATHHHHHHQSPYDAVHATAPITTPHTTPGPSTPRTDPLRAPTRASDSRPKPPARCEARAARHQRRDATQRPPEPSRVWRWPMSTRPRPRTVTVGGRVGDARRSIAIANYLAGLSAHPIAPGACRLPIAAAASADGLRAAGACGGGATVPLTSLAGWVCGCGAGRWCVAVVPVSAGVVGVGVMGFCMHACVCGSGV